MKPLQNIAFIGNYLPRRCGIATFTHDLQRAVSASRMDLDTWVVAMNDQGSKHTYPKIVRCEVGEQNISDYVQAAEFINRERPDVVSLQHEYGIFGGEAGSHILELLSRLEMPVVSTLHTVLREPPPAHRAVMERIIGLSDKLVVMSEKGRDFLRTVHGVCDDKIKLIPHGIPEYPFAETTAAKAKFGFSGKTVILTFGLLSPSKGIETVIDAMPAILRSCPTAVYVVLGATHPNLVRDQGESYREGLHSRAEQLGISDHVVFLNQFVDQATLLDYISMCDIYVTPYLNEAQMTSGTLAYSFGLGKAVISTPYWHAQELLGDGRGILVPFGDTAQIGSEIAALLSNDVRRRSMGKNAYTASRSMTWAQTAKRYLSAFGSAIENDRQKHRQSVKARSVNRQRYATPEIRTGHLLAMCDSTGLLQHAVHGIPDRSHGYCVDDNARGLLLACALGCSDEPSLPPRLSTQFAAFIQHAWNPDTRRFRNFMSYDRRWLEDAGSEDSHGRTLWALGVCAAKDVDPSRRGWAAQLFKTALPPMEEFTSPRAWAFALLGLDAFCVVNRDIATDHLVCLLADRLMSALVANKREGWVWFEDVLGYDNARIPQALIQTGLTMNIPAYTSAGLQSLRWLVAVQTAPSGCFRPVGSESFGKVYQRPAQFDQQPLEAAATISACLAAAQADASAEWPAGVTQAFNWFLGDNDLRTVVADLSTGGCRDGLHADRPNENQGAESVLSYMLGLVAVRQSRRARLVAAPSSLSPSLALSA